MYNVQIRTYHGTGEPAQASVLYILFIASHRGGECRRGVIANWQTKATADKKCVNTQKLFPQMSHVLGMLYD